MQITGRPSLDAQCSAGLSRRRRSRLNQKITGRLSLGIESRIFENSECYGKKQVLANVNEGLIRLFSGRVSREQAACFMVLRQFEIRIE